MLTAGGRASAGARSSVVAGAGARPGASTPRVGAQGGAAACADAGARGSVATGEAAGESGSDASGGAGAGAGGGGLRPLTLVA